MDCVRTMWTWLIDIVCYTTQAAAAAATNTDRYGKKTYRKYYKGGAAKRDAKETDDAKDNTNNKTVSFSNVAPLPGPVGRFFIEAILCIDNPKHPLFSTLMNYTFLFPSMRPNQVFCPHRHLWRDVRKALFLTCAT